MSFKELQPVIYVTVETLVYVSDKKYQYFHWICMLDLIEGQSKSPVEYILGS